jgi:hypothetical protein
MLRFAFYALALSLGVGAWGAQATGEEIAIPAKAHPWGQFVPGTWKVVHVVAETFDDQGQVASTSTTDTKTTLVRVDKDGVTLRVETCVEVAGKLFQSEPQTIHQGFHGEALGPSLKLKEPVDGEVLIEGRKIPCRIQEVSFETPAAKTDVKLYYSASVAPYLLKRTCVVTDPDGKSTISETDMDVIALEMPARFRNETRVGAYVRSVHKTAKATVTTLAVMAPEVPGGVLSHSSKEVGSNGQPLHRSTLELLNCNADPEKEHSGLFGQKRPPRRTKPPVRYDQ